MKKIIVALTLSMALTLSLAATAFAAPNDTGEGSVEFTGTENPEIVDPTTPPGPEDPDYSTWGIESADIYFGSHDLTTVETNYNSISTAEHPGGDKLGLLIKNRNTRDWDVTMSIDVFKVGTASSIANYDLALTKVTEEKADGTSASAETTIALTPNVSQRVMQGTGTGMIGTNWTGVLTVPANGVLLEGNNQAVITWTATGATPVAP